ncbi:aspartate racemase [Pochonia chlamydosporia 170]|uniref:Aspartate racemase n=1 Tax=Pochonia chlamydosporia 170 TaxID=1380566 RepID=A0A179FK08_METCM|nr:aspartate racemase [Pochonia chlamydosporia 170]OAQ65339.1 aspartate racemase [Pochonia chlamydosporia 170]
MKTIGIIGGMAWPSTINYYRTINEYYKEYTKAPGLESPTLVITQPNLALIDKLEEEGKWDDVGKLLVAEATKLKAAGAEFFLMACNTVHIADAYVTEHAPLPMLHIVDAAAKIASDRGFGTVGLLGSQYTMTGSYFVGRLKQKYNITAMVPDEKDQAIIQGALQNELAKGVFRPETRQQFKEAIEDLVTKGCQAIILGCTEFGLLVKQEDSTVPIIDTGIVHAKAAVEFAVAGE